MRRHLSAIIVSASFVVAVSGIGVGAAGAAVPRTSVKILSGTDCTPASMYCFKQSAKTIVTGTKIVWKNLTAAPHTVTRCTAVACSGDSGGTGTDTGFGGSVPVGGKYKFIFHGTGTYSYYCSIHGYAVMHGTVTVTA